MRAIRFMVLFSAACLLHAPGLPVSAEIYQYTDDQGTIHYTNDLSTIPEDFRQNATVSEEVEHVPAPSREQTAADTPAAKAENDAGPTRNSSENLEETPSGSEGAIDFKQQRQVLLEKKERLDAQYQELTRERRQLQESNEQLRTKEEIESYNQQVRQLNEKISSYQQQREALESKIEQFNEQVRSRQKQQTQQD